MARVTISSNNLFPGPRGAQGPAGPSGGPEGPAGPQGLQGNVGPQGAQGIQGPAGPTGAGGAQGPKGDTGNKGDKGDTGEPGTNGTNGTNGVGVPAGGTAGQILAKIDATDYNDQWVTPLSAVPPLPYVEGRFYKSPNILGYGSAPFNATNNFYLPFYVFSTNTFDRIAIATGATFSGTASVRLGIYNNNNGLPSTVLLDAGTVSATAASTNYSITISQSLSVGWYWLACNSITGATINNFVAMGTGTGWPTLANTGGTSLNGNSSNGYFEFVNASSGFATAGTLSGTGTIAAMALRSA
jgi:hypothetical protein